MGEHRKNVFSLLLVLVVILATSLITLSQSVYEWYTISYDFRDSSGNIYNVIRGKSIAVNEYSLINNTINVYALYMVNQEGTSYNWSIISLLNNSNGTILNTRIITSSRYEEVIPEHVSVSPNNSFIALTMTGNEEIDLDGILWIGYPNNLSMINAEIFDGISSNANMTIFYGLYIANDNTIWVTGTVYNTSSNTYEGLILVFKYNSTGLYLLRGATYTYNDPLGYSNNLMFVNPIIGPDGYLYVAGYVPYPYQGELFDYRGVVEKIDPITLDIINYRIFYLNSTEGYVRSTGVHGSISCDDQYLYVAYNIDYYNSTTGRNTGAGLIVKLDTNLNTIWEKIWDEPYNNEYLYTIETTSKYVIVGGGTDDNYGNNSFSDINNMLIILNKTDGSPVYAVLSGGSGREYIEELSVDAEGKTYSISTTNSSSIYFNIVYNALSVKNNISKKIFSINNQHKGIINGKYSVMKNNKHVLIPRPRKKTTKKNREVLTYMSIPDSVLRENLIHGDFLSCVNIRPSVINIRQTSTGGLVVKYGISVGAPVSPPPPLPENSLVVIGIVVLTLAIISVLVLKKYTYLK